MKTTLDLPPNLVRAMKVRAARDGRKLKEVAAEVVRAGLAAQTNSSGGLGPKVIKDKKTGLPVIQCRHAAKRDEEMTPERVAALLAEQEAGWANDTG
jgi:hypothetical protein